LLLDFSNVKFLSSAALAALVDLRHKVKALEGRIGLCHINSIIEEVFRTTRLDELFEIHS
jgi:anti-sigma B factor antagonist